MARLRGSVPGTVSGSTYIPGRIAQRRRVLMAGLPYTSAGGARMSGALLYNRQVSGPRTAPPQAPPSATPLAPPTSAPTQVSPAALAGARARMIAPETMRPKLNPNDPTAGQKPYEAGLTGSPEGPDPARQQMYEDLANARAAEIDKWKASKNPSEADSVRISRNISWLAAYRKAKLSNMTAEEAANYATAQMQRGRAFTVPERLQMGGPVYEGEMRPVRAAMQQARLERLGFRAAESGVQQRIAERESAARLAAARPAQQARLFNATVDNLVTQRKLTDAEAQQVKARTAAIQDELASKPKERDRAYELALKLIGVKMEAAKATGAKYRAKLVDTLTRSLITGKKIDLLIAKAHKAGPAGLKMLTALTDIMESKNATEELKKLARARLMMSLRGGASSPSTASTGARGAPGAALGVGAGGVRLTQ